MDTQAGPETTPEDAMTKLTSEAEALARQFAATYPTPNVQRAIAY